MDPVSAAASVIAVIQISAELVALCRRCFSEVKEAKTDIQQFRNEVTSLDSILIDLRDLVDTPDGTKLPILDASLKQCQSTLEELVRKLEKAEGNDNTMKRFGWRALKWPFNSSDVKKAIETIERHKNMFNLALTADQT
ncbi:hypothetical protein MMC31_004198, partial [Peltigera leucophlebia]|nr:hypothetical protein [Peltigera leucophlebia]